MLINDTDLMLPPALQGSQARSEPTRADAVSRRTFLKIAGAGGFALGAFPLRALAQNAPSTAEPLKPSQQPSAFLHIAPDGIVTVTVNRLEFGQGVQTALPMILAEELDADWNNVRSRLGDQTPAYADPVRGMHLTGGSASIRTSFTQYRELGARARAMLIAAAADRWKVDPSTLRAQTSRVLAPDGRSAGYGQLAQAAMAQDVPSKITLKNPSDFSLIGQPTTRLDAKAKSSGRQDFGIDVKLPGQLTAVIARPPVFGARLRSVDDSAARALPGVKAIFRLPIDLGGEAVAVVANGYWPAHQGRQALKLEWDTEAVEKVDSARQLTQYRELAAKPGARHFDADMTLLAGAPLQIEAEFTFPYLAHASMEPLNCTVRISDEGADIWTGSQMPGVDAEAAAKTLGLKPDQIRMTVQSSGGGFGRRAMGHRDYVVDACRVAHEAKRAGLDAPVQLVWSREDDMRGGFYRPMHLHRAHIGFDEQGHILAWDHVIVAQSITKGTLFEKFMVKEGIDRTAVEGMRDPYPVPMRLTVHHPELNVPVHWWRSVGSTHTAYVMETLLDEIARRTDKDPVAYRLELLGDKFPRQAAALQLAVDKSGYGKKQLAAGRAWGVAMHECFGSVVAYVVEASINTGQPVLHRAVAGVHCNLAVNPRTVEAQVQGSAVMALAMCLPGGAITLKDGVVEQGNFGEYAVPRITDIPEFEVHVVPSAEPPSGMGEPGLPPLAPAFANAVARLTGKPVRALPIKLA